LLIGVTRFRNALSARGLGAHAFGDDDVPINLSEELMTTSDDTQDNTGDTQDDTGATQEPSDPTTSADDSADPGTTDTGDSDTTDTGSTDTGSSDLDTTDTGSTDTGSTDSDTTDTGTTDTGSTDSDTTDTGSTDSDSTDTGSTDAGDPNASDADSDPAASESDDGAAATGDDAGSALPTDEAGGGAASDGNSSAAPIDLGPPYLIVDQYSGDSGMNPPWSTLVGLPQYYGVILKAWEGTAFNDGGWFAHNWPAVRQAGTDRYGSSWFRGAYLFLKFNASGPAQADAYLKAVDAAGGWDSGDILPIVDVELGGTSNSNHMASKQQVIDCVSACTARLKEQTGRRVMLYGRGAMRDLHISEKMGADVAWNPSYTPTMHKAGLEGFALDEIVLWQYCGDNQSALPNYPHQVKGFAKLDISVFIKGSAEPTLDDVRAGLLT
jgi:Glycosyl hydrolases family 25